MSPHTAEEIVGRSDGAQVRITVGEDEYVCEVASTPVSRFRGLQGREELPNDGMLFIYTKPNTTAFDLTKMKFPIDVVFFDEAGVVVESAQEGHLVVPEDAYLFVLETSPSRVDLDGSLRIHELL